MTYTEHFGNQTALLTYSRQISTNFYWYRFTSWQSLDETHFKPECSPIFGRVILWCHLFSQICPPRLSVFLYIIFSTFLLCVFMIVLRNVEAKSIQWWMLCLIYVELFAVDFYVTFFSFCFVFQISRKRYLHALMAKKQFFFI